MGAVLSLTIKHPKTLRGAAIAAAFAALAAVACSPLPSRPEHAATDFVVNDPVLAGELRAAAEDWARAGLVVAEYVTINQSSDGVPVREQPRTRLPFMCNMSAQEADKVDDYAYADGCAAYYQDHFEGMWIASDLSPERRAVVLRHELIHFLVPDAEHISDAEQAIFAVHGTASSITSADMGEMAKHTEVTAPEGGEL
jgi:hypothetical protein